ncbi:hypothetical protein I4F81_003514 [Pyropia yezoensis]|uniref:Uncharacterized protein n=1 Tax=Pyropia yezoensis TaxID=2788 RepID=A0ACC3BTP2_PYRYE|nr:hypothetical protein I4F81_003514 [Neopyropia yezoensis]
MLQLEREKLLFKRFEERNAALEGVVTDGKSAIGAVGGFPSGDAAAAVGDLQYSDLVMVDARGNAVSTPLYVRRFMLVGWSAQPWFDRAVTGLFVRVSFGQHYQLARVKSVRVGGEPYMLDTTRTNKRLVCAVAGRETTYEMLFASNSTVTQAEFDSYASALRAEGESLPSRLLVNELMEQGSKARDGLEATPEEQAAFRTNMEKLFPERVNYTQKKAEIRSKMDALSDDIEVANAAGDDLRVRELTGIRDDMDDAFKAVIKLEQRYGPRSRAANSTGSILAARAAKNVKTAFGSGALGGAGVASLRALAGRAGRGDPGSALWSEVLTSAGVTADVEGKGVALDEEAAAQRLRDAYVAALAGVAEIEMELDRLGDADGGQAAMPLPPGVDTVYGRRKGPLPGGTGKIIFLAEYSRMQTG